MTLSSVAACDNGHWGPDCIHPCNCSAGHGSCDAVSGLCLCEAGYEGAQCEQCEYRARHSYLSPQCAHWHARAHDHTREHLLMHMCVCLYTRT